jgi:hypothetical protein
LLSFGSESSVFLFAVNKHKNKKIIDGITYLGILRKCTTPHVDGRLDTNFFHFTLVSKVFNFLMIYFSIGDSSGVIQFRDPKDRPVSPLRLFVCVCVCVCVGGEGLSIPMCKRRKSRMLQNLQYACWKYLREDHSRHVKENVNRNLIASGCMQNRTRPQCKVSLKCFELVYSRYMQKFPN